MKTTIKQLQEKLEDVERERDVNYEMWRKLKEEKDRKQMEEMTSVRSERNRAEEQVRNLMEIIRWQINPSTATSPFAPTKEQRDGRIEPRY